jgi:hypothetical protein
MKLTFHKIDIKSFLEIDKNWEVILIIFLGFIAVI